MDKIKLTLWCPAERIEIGTVEADLGDRVTRQYLEERIAVGPEFMADGFSRSRCVSGWRDGLPATCPRCGNVAAWAPSGDGSLEAALAERFDPPLSSFTVAGHNPRRNAKNTGRAKPGRRPGVDPALRASPLIADDEERKP